jgi:tetratricopeptide (TPR) repeat protein
MDVVARMPAEMQPPCIDTALAMRAAAAALAGGNRNEALAQWRLARSATDAPIEAWTLAAVHCNGGQASQEAVVLFESALARFPGNLTVLHQLARAHEQRSDWKSSEGYWRAILEAGDDRWWVFAALMESLRRQHLHSEARIVMAAAAARHPDTPEILGEAAKCAQAQGDFPESLRLWEYVISRFPDNWFGYRGKIAILKSNDQTNEADNFLNAHAPAFPDDVHALHDIGRLAERHLEWERAEGAWRSFIALEPRPQFVYLSLAKALREQAKFAEADKILKDGLERFPQDIELAIDAAKCSEERQEWFEALRRWRELSHACPNRPDGALGEAALLRQHGLTETADDVIIAATKRLPDEPTLREAYGVNAMSRGAWPDALIRFEEAQKRFPSINIFRQRIFEIRLRVADGGEGKLALPPVAGTSGGSVTEASALVIEFESLGGGGHGCEFGIFQRNLGAEPLGLLRWADIYQDALSQALETEFAGIGEPEFTNVFVPGGLGHREYWTTDSRYHMAMRCFVSADDVPFERMTKQVTRRLRYLRNKLIDDLRLGAKIFVYKNMKRNLTDEELSRLHAACRRYGDNTLLYIRYEDQEHRSGCVNWEREGLLVGYIDHFSHTPDTDKYIGSADDSLLLICTAAYTLWRARYPAVEDMKKRVLAETMGPEAAEV